MSNYITTNVDVDVYIADIMEEIDDDDLIEELERRGLDMNSQFVDGDTMRRILTNLWLKRRNGQDYQKELNDLIYYGLGKVV